MVYNGMIVGKTVNFRAIEERDAEITLKMRLDTNLNAYLNKVEDSVEKQKAYIITQRQKEGDYLFVAEDKLGNVIGMRGIYDFDPERKTCETGRLISQGNAIQNTEIAMFGYDFAFEYLGVDKIRLTVIDANKTVLNGHKRYGAIELECVYMKDFGTYSIVSELSRDRYMERRPEFYKLIERFAV